MFSYENANQQKPKEGASQVAGKCYKNRSRLMLLIVAALSVSTVFYFIFLSVQNADQILKSRSREEPLLLMEDAQTNNDSGDYRTRNFSINDLKLLRQKVRNATNKLDEDLKKEYGKYYNNIFSADYSYYFDIGLSSKKKLQRRMMKKVIEANAIQFSKKKTFTWVTSGHSAAAGHGNLFNQSYTSTMQTIVSEVFSSAGLKFIGKNYGMGGGIASGPELSMCMEAIYGSDIDIISWDFDITDGRDDWLAALWSARGANHPTQPILAFIDKSEKRWENVNIFEKSGVGVFRLFDMSKAYKDIPDFENGQNQTSLPESLQYFICNGKPEVGSCDKHKWNTLQYCPKITGQVKWHHGWKIHHLRGVLLGNFMVKMLNESLDQLTSMAFSSEKWVLDDLMEALNDMRRADNTDRDLWKKSIVNIPELRKKDETSFLQQLSISLYKGNTMCSSALLPSDSRYNGLLTGGKGTFGGIYDEGMDFEDAYHRSSNTNGKNISMAIVKYVDRENKVCKDMANRDSQDYFYIPKSEDQNVWQTRMVPNNAEYDAFSKEDVSLKNYIMICHQLCNSGSK